MKKNKIVKSQSAQLKALLELDRKTQAAFLTDAQRADPAFMRRFKKFVKTGKL